MSEVEIYTTRWCPFCIRAKMLLEQKGVSYQEIAVDQQPELRAQMMAKSGGNHTVPQIFIDQQHIGGCDDLYALERQGKLDPLLQQSQQDQ